MQWILTQIHETHAEKLFRKDDQTKKKSIDNCFEAEAARELCCKILRYKRYKGNKVVASKHTNSEYADVSDLLLWSIFANRKELAEICWLRGKDHLYCLSNAALE